MEEITRDKQCGDINTQKYWEYRFREGDWDKYDGGEQSAFFAQIALAAFPVWLKWQMKRHDWTVTDWGCAEGEGTALIAREFPNCQFTGIDFSPAAIEKAQVRFPFCHFETGDLLGEIGQSDIIFSSNTLEHMKEPGPTLKRLVSAARQHAVILLPLHDQFDIAEHFHCFDEEFFPLELGNHILSYFQIVDCDGAALWSGEQLLLVYSAKTALHSERRLSEMFSNTEYEKLKRRFTQLREDSEKERERHLKLQQAAALEKSELETRMNAELENQRKWAEKLTDKLHAEEKKSQISLEEKEASIQQLQERLTAQVERADTDRASFEREIARLREEKLTVEQELERILTEKKLLQEQLKQASVEQAALQNQLKLDVHKQEALQKQLELVNDREKFLHQRVEQTTVEKSALQKQQGEVAAEKLALQKQLERANTEQTVLQAQLVSENEKISDALSQLRAMTGSRLFKAVHFLNRWKYQGCSSDPEERKKFRSWLFSRFRHVPDRDHRYNPLFTAINLLERSVSAEHLSATAVGSGLDRPGELAKHLREQKTVLSVALSAPLTGEAQKLREIISQRQYKGILIYPHTVYWEPLQTPQQLLRAFAQEGWLCFFCEHPNLQEVCREEEPNLFITYEQDILQAIGNTHVNILLTWMGSHAFVDQFPNKAVWYHILDHLEIFAYYDRYYLELHNLTITSANVVTYVAEPLSKWTCSRLDAVYLPNGVNATEISKIHEGVVPEDMAPIIATGHKIIGYYGYLAEWMDYEMVRKMALLRPDWEFVLVGNAIYDVSLIQNLPNVHLLGLKPYKELPDYAKFFDAATIPFLINEKMDCVSPIKFYEYLALGKPVVSSYMKELSYYALVWEFIACAKGPDEFLFYLEQVTNPEVQAAARKNGPLIAAQNSWSVRAQRMEDLLLHNHADILTKPYINTDVIILSIIDYTFRHQRPQHFAQRLAQKEHRVFYLNANFTQTYEQVELSNHLWQVTLPGAERGAIHLTDWADAPMALEKALDLVIEQNAIRDAVVIVDYPNWVHGARYLRKKYGFCMVTDYMDDFTGFLNPSEDLVRKNCELLLKESDGVMASSQFLYDIAAKYSGHVVMNRNGTEFAYFHQAFCPSQGVGRKSVIGYYGAIAEWFNADIVCRCAERFPNSEIVLVGNVTAHRKQLAKYKNIRLVGEVPYTELLPWLQSFDVCLIPFDATTNLIKATNPVKFYEYLSAGKRIVATEIPELEPYRGHFAYLENDPEKFCDAVAACLDGVDTLASPEECFTFAMENDWDERARVFEEEALAVYPKISVIVLCYNQLEYTKQCVESVLNVTAYPNYELVLVDNCSSDDTASYLKSVAAAHDNVKLVLNRTNRGFAGGNNDGIHVSEGEYLVLLNNDTVVTRGWLTGLLKHFRNDTTVGLVGPITNSIGNEAKINTPYLTLYEMPAFADRYTFQHMGEEYPHHGILAMFCLMMSRELYEKVGPLDEEYGIGMFEDDDYSTASQKLGYRNVLAEDVFIHHFGSVSFKKLEDSEYMKLFQQNQRYFEKKWGVKWSKAQFRPGVR